jgi:hypothetical protein
VLHSKTVSVARSRTGETVCPHATVAGGRCNAALVPTDPEAPQGSAAACPHPSQALPLAQPATKHTRKDIAAEFVGGAPSEVLLLAVWSVEAEPRGLGIAAHSDAKEAFFVEVLQGARGALIVTLVECLGDSP